MTCKHKPARLIALLVLAMIISGWAGPQKSPAQRNDGCSAGSEDDTACNVIEGFSGNDVSADATGATISGGGKLAFANQVTGDFGTVGGGLANQAGEYATVSGGAYNIASIFRATVAGGSHNTASAEHGTIGGGADNTASGPRATVAGGASNTASSMDATVGGGSGNIASFTHATVSGGTRNTASSLDASVGGGDGNTASGAYATVGGGANNAASGYDTMIGGGSGNIASGENATVSGGLGNRASDNYGAVGGGLGNHAGNANDDLRDAQYTTVGGGRDNTASSFGASVGGGLNNTAGGSLSTVPGGFSNSAAGGYSFAAGRRANVAAAHDGAFLYADANDFDFHSLAANEFAVRATGGIRFVTAIDGSGNPSAGARLATGSSSWASLSDRNAKANVAPVDGRQVLERLVAVPISSWNYMTQDPAIRHIGPMARDFYATFGMGEDSRYISTVDADGVALAAIQGLYQMVQEKDDRIAAQQGQIAALNAEMAVQQEHTAALEARVAVLEQATGLNGAPSRPASPALLANWLLAGGLCLAGLALGRRWRNSTQRNPPTTP